MNLTSADKCADQILRFQWEFAALGENRIAAGVGDQIATGLGRCELESGTLKMEPNIERLIGQHGVGHFGDGNQSEFTLQCFEKWLTNLAMV